MKIRARHRRRGNVCSGGARFDPLVHNSAAVVLRAAGIAAQAKPCAIAARAALKNGESEDRLFAVAAWRDAPYFNDAERAALALSEAVTRLSDRADPVPDEIWNEAARHYDERGLAALLLAISVTNVFNRINVATPQPAGSWTPPAPEARRA